MRNSQIDLLQTTRLEIQQSVLGYHLESSSNEQFGVISQDLLAKLFCDQFIYLGFSKVAEKPESIDYFKIFEIINTDQLNFSAFVFKIVSFFEAKNMAKEGIMMLNNLLESYCNLEYLDRAYVIIKFIFWLSERLKFDQINDSYYANLLEQILEALPNAEHQLEEAFAITVAKYEQLVQLTEFFAVRFTLPQNHLKILKKAFLNTYQFTDEKYKYLDDFTMYCLMFDNAEICEELTNFEKRLWRLKFNRIVRPLFSRFKTESSLRKSFTTVSNKYFVLKFNYKSKSRKFRYLMIKQDRIGVLALKNLTAINSFKHKGVCKLTRFRG